MLTSSPDSVEEELQMVLADLVRQSIVLCVEEGMRKPQHRRHCCHHAGNVQEPAAQGMVCL